MAYIADIVLVVVFAVVIISSAKKGFFKSLIDLAGSLVAFILAKAVSEGMAEGFYNRFIASPVTNALNSKFDDIASSGTAQLEKIVTEISDSLGGALELIGINKEDLLEKISQAELNGDNFIEEIIDTVVYPVGIAIAGFILTAIFALVFIIAIRIISRLLDKVIKKLPVIKSCNKLLGAVFGVLRGAIVVVILSMLISVIVSFADNAQLTEIVQSSTVIEAVRGLVTSMSGFEF